MSLIIRVSFCTSYGKNLAELHYQPNEGQFAKYCPTPRNHRFPLVFWCVSCKQQFGALTVKFLLDQIMTHTMASLKNTVKHFII